MRKLGFGPKHFDLYLYFVVLLKKGANCLIMLELITVQSFYFCDAENLP
jgi:hypothetical protein